jgi:hypothetical protein
MSPPNGHAKDPAVPDAANHSPETHAVHQIPTDLSGNQRFSHQEIKDVCAALEVPFDPRVIDWRVTNTSKNRKLRGQVIPYADQRAYTDRLNQLFTPAGWTRKYQVHTSANFERSKDQKTVAKVFVTCELSIGGLGVHSATGEEWADDENAGTSAEAQAFKRAAACFGLGRYLYYFEGAWVDLDDRKRPRSVPRLPQWAIPDGWLKGVRPNMPRTGKGSAEKTGSHVPADDNPQNRESSELVRQIEEMAKPLGRRLYRGVLRVQAKVWNPEQIPDVVLQRKILEQMQSAERGLERLHAALSKTGPAALVPTLEALKIRSLDHVDSLEMLKRVVLAVEAAASALK